MNGFAASALILQFFVVKVNDNEYLEFYWDSNR